jgi:peptide/nickel transport system substrate-binding protein
MMFYMNMSYDADPEIAKWINTRDFRRALSLGIQRDQLNETFWLGTGTPGSPVVDESHPHSPGPEYRKLWATYEPARANAMLDQIGLDKKDGEGFRLRTDGKGRLKIDLITIPAFMDYTGACEMVARQWRQIGIYAEVKEVERGLQERLNDANQLMIFVRDNTTSDSQFTVLGSVLPIVPGAGMGPEFGKWYSSGGKAGKKPTDPQILKAFDLFTRVPSLPTQERNKVGQEIWKLFIDEVWGIGTVGLAPGVLGVRVVKNNMGNVPQRLSTLRAARMPSATHPETYYFKS